MSVIQLRPIFILRSTARAFATSASFHQKAAASDRAASHQEEKAARMERAPSESASFGMNLFRGVANTSMLFPFPVNLDADQKETLGMVVEPVNRFFEEINDADKNDHNGQFDQKQLKQFAELGSFGVLVPAEFEGAGFNNTQMGRMAEIVGANDLALGVTMGAHQSIGYKGILLVGTDAQKKKYLPDLASGRKFASFALTEPSSGSDANSIRTRAELSKDGKHYVLNGSKIWITNAGFAEVFTVFAQTPVEKDGVTKDKVSAFIVERKFGGVTTGPPEKKMGIKASNTAEVHFDDVKVPVENLLGAPGDGFKVAMNILNNGRFGIPAAMTGAMRHCIGKTVEHVTSRVQFGRKLEEYGDVQEKLANMAIKHYVTETITYVLSSNMDQGHMEYQIEAAIGKVLSSESAWTVCDDAIQVLGGMGFMREPGLERVLRDLRIFRIFEGANDVMRLFIALTGIQFAAGHLRQLQKAVKSPASNVGLLLGEVGKRVGKKAGFGTDSTLVDKSHSDLKESAKLATDCVSRFGTTVENLLVKHGKNIMDQQFALTRLANSAIDIYSMAVVLARCTRSLEHASPSAAHEKLLVEVFCRQASDRTLDNLSIISSKRHNADFANMTELSKEICDNMAIVHQHPLGV